MFEPSHQHSSQSEAVSWVQQAVLDPQRVRTLQPHQAIALLAIQGHSRDDIIHTFALNV